MEEYIIKAFSTVVCIIVHRNPHWTGEWSDGHNIQMLVMT